MKIKVQKFQEGGPVPAGPEAGGAPAPAAPGAPAPEQGGQDPLMQLAEIFTQGLQNQDCAALSQGAEMFLQLLQQTQGGGAPAEGGAPPAEQPVYKRGGKMGKITLAKKVSKKC